MSDMTTIYVSRETQQRVNLAKYQIGAKTQDATINRALDALEEESVDYYDRPRLGSGLPHVIDTVEVADGVSVAEFAWYALGDGQPGATEEHVGLTVDQLHKAGFRKRADQAEHPGA